tara:strand:- start:6875 stop:7603 length:729 start_codon:yes stop_codon:yes gene_type:complete
MKIEAHIIAYNEEMMLPFTLDYYSKLCDNIIIYDNYSSDNTVEICKKYPKVSIEKFHSRDELSDMAYLQVKNERWKDSKADWIIVCDTDEILYFDTDIRQRLELMDYQQVSLPAIQGYNMFSDTFPESGIDIIDQVKMGIREKSFDKQILFNRRHIKEINYNYGCHVSRPVGKIKTGKYEPFLLLHYKYLGIDYLTKRHEMYAKRMSRFNRMNGFGVEYLEGGKRIEQIFSESKNKLKKIIK